MVRVTTAEEAQAREREREREQRRWSRRRREERGKWKERQQQQQNNKPQKRAVRKMSLSGMTAVGGLGASFGTRTNTRINIRIRGLRACHRYLRSFAEGPTIPPCTKWSKICRSNEHPATWLLAPLLDSIPDTPSLLSVIIYCISLTVYGRFLMPIHALRFRVSLDSFSYPTSPLYCICSVFCPCHCVSGLVTSRIRIDLPLPQLLPSRLPYVCSGYII